MNDKKYESDNAVNIEEGRKRNEHNLSYHRSLLKL